MLGVKQELSHLLPYQPSEEVTFITLISQRHMEVSVKFTE